MVVPRRRIDPGEGRAALAAWQAANGPAPGATASAGAEAVSPVPRGTLATAVRYSWRRVTARAPGNSVEVRVPPFGVTQCVEARGIPGALPRTSAVTPPPRWRWSAGS